MSFFQFTKNLVGVGTENAAASLTEAIVRLAPDAATAAELRTMEQALDAAGEKIQQMHRQHGEEQHTYEAILARYTTMMSAAEHLEGQINTEADATKKTALEASLVTLTDQIEAIAPELDQDKKDVEATTALLADMEAAYQAKAKELTTAKANLERGKQGIVRAKITEERAEQRSEAARVAAGLTTSTSNVHTALDAMQRIQQKALDHAGALDLKANALKGSKTADEDPNIAAAMAAASGTSAAASVADRLAALRQRQA